MTRPLPERVELRLTPDDDDDDASLRQHVARHLGVPIEALPGLSLLRKVIDARRNDVHLQLTVALHATPALADMGEPLPREVKLPARIVIVGDGPCGLFCAYELARRGIASIIVDRGKTVMPRRFDLRGLNREHRIDEHSNYCHGEGGAGTYSDGKLWTRATKRGEVRDVLETLARHHAPLDILVEGRPHIGSNLLPKVITAMRERLEACGVRFLFGHQVVGVTTTGQGDARKVSGVSLQATSAADYVVDGLECDAVVMATGHSARDVYRMLHAMDVRLEPKAFALGVRIEHPQPMINQMQYGRYAGHNKLPSAAYRIAHTTAEGGCFSFCMCPGGFIVPASTDGDGLVVNGMSLKKRDSPFANSGLVASVSVEDGERAGFSGPLGLLSLQEAIERAAKQPGSLAAPAVRASDFVTCKLSSTLPKTSYQPGLVSADLVPVLDAAGMPIARRLREALNVFGNNMPGYVSEEAVLVGVESRTSSPVRIIRDKADLQSPSLRGLYPAGEGAGYAGGIVSAALDGIAIAHAIAHSA